MTGLFT